MAAKFTTWAFTLNNYTEQELAQIRSMPEFIKQCIWELEKGETPHVQGYIKLKTNQRLSFLRSHYLARAHYTGLTTEEWKQNTKKYVQKQDETAVGCVVQDAQTQRTFFPAEIPELLVQEMCDIAPDYRPFVSCGTVLRFERSDGSCWHWKELYERAMRQLIERYRIETMVVRPDMERIVRSFYVEISRRIVAQQTNADYVPPSNEISQDRSHGSECTSSSSSRRNSDSVRMEEEEGSIQTVSTSD